MSKPCCTHTFTVSAPQRSPACYNTSMQQTVVRKIDKNATSDVYNNLKHQNFQEIPDSNQYVQFKMQAKGITVTLYTSGKIVFQGQSVDAILVDKLLAQQETTTPTTSEVPKRPKNPSKQSSITSEVQIGGDESGKGDFFGPLVVAMVAGTKQDLDWLIQLGVTDSKKMKDDSILKMAPKIEQRLTVASKSLSPEEYNARYAQVTNIALLLSEIYKELSVELISSIKKQQQNHKKMNPFQYVVTIDQFSQSKRRLIDALHELTKSQNVTLRQFHKAEREPIVAAASIIARAEFLKGMEKMSKQWDIDFPKGAANVITTGKTFVSRYGRENLHKVAKLHFKTTQQVLH